MAIWSISTTLSRLRSGYWAICASALGIKKFKFSWPCNFTKPMTTSWCLCNGLVQQKVLSTKYVIDLWPAPRSANHKYYCIYTIPWFVFEFIQWLPSMRVLHTMWHGPNKQECIIHVRVRCHPQTSSQFREECFIDNSQRDFIKGGRLPRQAY